MHKPKEFLFLTLKIFSSTGGIEKVCRIAGKALNEIGETNEFQVKIFSLHDKTSDIDERYFSRNCFAGYEGKQVKFVLQSIMQGRKSDAVFLSHINLLPVGYFIKCFSPTTKLILFAHGIEVWGRLGKWKRKMLKKCDLILPVSSFTKQIMSENLDLPGNKFIVLNNCLDPFLAIPVIEDRESTREKYNLTVDNKVLLTLTRFSNNEIYKGYDKVLAAVAILKKEYPGIRYLLAGKCDDDCKIKIQENIRQLGIEENTIFTGFIPDEQLAGLFSIADLFVMPSMKEGFGIVFIEAMNYGLPVIAGNKDGSVDALLKGELGTLVDPESQKEINDAINRILKNRDAYMPERQKVIDNFSYPVYKEKLKKIIGEAK